jgi:Ca2+-binding RTX toxin-like protein
MPIPLTSLDLASAIGLGWGYVLTPQEPLDFSYLAPDGTAPLPGSTWLAAIGDVNGDGLAEILTGVPGSSDQYTNAGRVYLTYGGSGPDKLGDTTITFAMDGGTAEDRIGFSVAAVGSMNGDALQEILLGAPLLDPGGRTDAGGAYVIFGTTKTNSLDLAEVNTVGSGKGFLIAGQAAGDHAGQVVAAIADLNADGRGDVLVAAPGNDAGGAEAGAAYVVFGKAGDAPVGLGAVAAGTGGFRIVGENAGDAAGTALASIADLNGDGKADILVGAPGADAGGEDRGAVYVVFGKSTGTAVNLDDVALGTGGWRIAGATDFEAIGSSVSAIGDVDADGKADILIGGAGSAYVVLGKAGTAAVSLADIAAGIGGFAIIGEPGSTLTDLSVTGGADLNRDGIVDYVIGAPHADADAGAVYVVWGGGRGTVDLSAIAIGAGGARISGSVGSYTGASVALVGDLNADGTADLLIGAPGAAAEAVSVLYAPASWQADLNVYGTFGDDVIGAGDGTALHVVGSGNDSVFGLDGADSIATGDGDDSLDGGAGADTMEGGAGNDVYVVDDAGDVVIEAAGGGADTVVSAFGATLDQGVEALVLTAALQTGIGSDGDNTLVGSTGADTLLGAGGADTIFGDAGNDSLDGGTGADSMAGGGGNDRYLVDEAGDLVTEAFGGGADTVTATVDHVLEAEVEALALAGTAHAGTGNGLANRILGGDGADSLLGLAGLDTLVGAGGDDLLDGGSGGDSMAGGGGDDRYLVDDAADRVLELAGGGADTIVAGVDFTLAAEVEVLELSGAARRGTGNAGANRLLGTDGADTLDGAAGADTLAGGGGDDTYVLDSAADSVTEAPGGGFDLVRAGFDYVLGAEVEALVLTGAARHGTGHAGDNLLGGGTGNDLLEGLGGADTLDGAGGADTLDGGVGADSMAGGAGNDRYLVEDAGDVALEAAGGGADTVVATVDYVLGAEVEKLVLAGAAHHGTGNGADNAIVGGAGDDLLEGLDGADTLDGGAGADTLVGGTGNDTYVITDPGDVVTEDATGGFDTVIVSTDWTLGGNIEGVQLIGSGHALTGNAENNLLSGNSGSDTLDGGEGDDVELAGDGDDVLVSAGGADTMSGGAGNDRFRLHGGSAEIEDFLGQDTIDASDASGNSSIDLSGETQTEIEGCAITFGQGGSAAGPLDLQFLQDVTGSFADDIATVRGLVPQIVAALQAVQPDSTYGVSTFRDKATGSFGNAGDWVYRMEASLSKDTAALTAAYTAMVAANGADAPEAQIEALMQLALRAGDVGFRTNSARFVVLFTDAPFHAAGDGLAAGITTANNGDAILDGTPAGTGEDYPLVAQVRAALEAANIIPIFASAGGTDAAYQSLVTQLGRGAQVTLTANSSNVVDAITGGLTAVTKTRIEDAWGGAGADTVKGSAGDNVLEGRGGDDLLAGAAGADRLLGGEGRDSLDGGADGDTMEGGGGDDAYAVDSAADLVVEAAAGGRDTVTSSIDYTLGDQLEALVLAGAASHGRGHAGANELRSFAAGWLEGMGGADTLVGNSGADTLDGGTGNDSMLGGAGDDRYLVDSTRDVVVEAAGGGRDTIVSSVSFALGAEVEALVLTGIAGLAGTGNVLGNELTGNAGGNRLRGGGGADTLQGLGGADTLDGGASADSMVGGVGNDLYIVNAATDRVLELDGEGFDVVEASVAWTLGAWVEKLVLTGTAALSGTGNALGNVMAGNDGANLLDGGEGADTLTGGAGADTLLGGLGDDLYDAPDATDLLVELPGGGIDTVRVATGWTLAAEIENLVLTGAETVGGIGNAGDNAITGNAAANLLAGGDGADTLAGGAGDDTLEGGAGDDCFIVDSLGDLVVELAGGGIDTVRSGIAWVLGAELEKLVLTGTAGVAGTGNGLDNLVAGNAGANALGGEGGADTLLGGGGADTLTGGEGNDVLAGGLAVDRLAGGLGHDAFRFDQPADGRDVILDFVKGEDAVWVSAVGFGGGLVEGVLDAAHFTAGTAAIGTGAQFVYTRANGLLAWDADGEGGAAAVQIAVITAKPLLAASDMLVIA